MADVVTTVDPPGFTVASTKYPVAEWQRVAISNNDGTWHGFRNITDQSRVVRVVLVIPSAAYAAAAAADGATEATRRASDTAARGVIEQLRSTVAQVAQGTGSLTNRQIAMLLRALGVR